MKKFHKTVIPPPCRGFMKAYFFWGYILGPLHCIVKKNRGMKSRWPLPPVCETFSQNRFFLKDGFPKGSLSLPKRMNFRKIDFFKKDGFPYFGLILTFFSTPVLMAFWQCTWPDSSQEIQLPSDQSGVKLTWWMQERDHKRSMKKYVGHTVVNLERTYISYMKYI